MSVTFELKDDLSNLPTIIQRYDDEIAKAKEHLTLDGKSLLEANREQASWYCHYYRLYQEVKSIQSVVEAKVEAKRGDLWRQFKENYSIALSSTDINHYIDGNASYGKMKQLLIVATEMVGMMNALVKAFEQRGYVLRNLTEARVHEVENALL